MWNISKFSLQSGLELKTNRMIDKVLNNWTTEAVFKGVNEYRLGKVARSPLSAFSCSCYPMNVSLWFLFGFQGDMGLLSPEASGEGEGLPMKEGVSRRSFRRPLLTSPETINGRHVTYPVSAYSILPHPIRVYIQWWLLVILRRGRDICRRAIFWPYARIPQSCFC